MTDQRRRNPVEHAVDLFVYAPLGLLFEAPHLLPRLVERGRQEADSRLRSLRLISGHGDEGAETADEPEPPEATAPAPAEPAAPRPPSPDPETLAIPDYESLSASQVVPRLEVLAPEELELIRQFELGNRHRATILNKIAQLQAD